jgi:hypothetical protein
VLFVCKFGDLKCIGTGVKLSYLFISIDEGTLAMYAKGKEGITFNLRCEF